MKQLDRRWKVLLVTGVAVFMAFLDVTIVNVAFPSIHVAFPDVSVAGLSWVLNAYNIVFAALLVPAGRLADLLGRRRLFFIGSGAVRRRVVSVRAGVVGRGAGGRAGAAGGRARRCWCRRRSGCCCRSSRCERRATATALWGAIGGVAAATGPSLGGLLISWADWRVVFFVNLVLGALAWVPARRLLRETRDPDRGAVPGRAGHRAAGRGRRAGLAGDRRGAVLGLGERAGARRVRCSAWSLLGGFVWRSAVHAHPGARARAVPRAVVRGGVHGRVRVLARGSTRCCWPTSCS